MIGNTVWLYSGNFSPLEQERARTAAGMVFAECGGDPVACAKAAATEPKDRDPNAQRLALVWDVAERAAIRAAMRDRTAPPGSGLVYMGFA